MNTTGSISCGINTSEMNNTTKRSLAAKIAEAQEPAIQDTVTLTRGDTPDNYPSYGKV